MLSSSGNWFICGTATRFLARLAALLTVAVSTIAEDCGEDAEITISAITILVADVQRTSSLSAGILDFAGVDNSGGVSTAYSTITNLTDLVLTFGAPNPIPLPAIDHLQPIFRFL